MKFKKTTIVPDNIYEVLGFNLPFSENKPEYIKGESITGFIGNQRIDTLKRESKYRTYYPKLKAINLLTLSYPSIPQNAYQKVSYIKKVIRKNIIKTLSSISPDKRISTECEKYVKGILSLYGDSIQVNRIQNVPNPMNATATRVLQTSELFCIRFQQKQDSVVYAGAFTKKKKDSYYYLKANPEKIVHIVDLPDFLVDVLLIQTIHHIQTSIQLPVIQNIFESFIQVYSKPDCELKTLTEVNDFISSLKLRTLLPDSLLFHDYSSNEKGYFKLGLSWDVSEKLIEVFCNILEFYQDIHYENKHRDEMSRTMATAYITKKNIPKNVLAAMDHISFKKYFKYVEFDEDVDLHAIRIIEKEFNILNEAYFSSKAFFDVTLRFRKLGKHKASGLYYPTLHTLCVDLRSPASFIHEYFHMIDNQLGDLSLETSFQDIVGEYKQMFLSTMNHLESDIQEQLSGRGKYNLQYFFRRAEIFARCGEIYFVRILKIESSLIQPDLKYAYPQSDRLDTLIKNYYEDLLNVKLRQADFSVAV